MRTLLAPKIAVSVAFLTALVACRPGGAAPAGHAVSERGNGAPSPKPQKDPTTSLIARDRDERPRIRQPRKTGLLVMEITGLEQLLQATPQHSPDRAKLDRRLAESYCELEAGAEQAQDRANARDEKLAHVAAGARESAIRHYLAIAHSGAKDCGSTLTTAPSCLDEVLYNLGLEYEHAGNFTEEKKVYLDLVNQFPNSHYAPAAYLAFGELGFEDSSPATNPIRVMAYRKAAEGGTGAVRADALLRLGQMCEAENDRDGARAAYAKLLRADPGSPAAAYVPQWAKDGGTSDGAPTNGASTGSSRSGGAMVPDAQ
jgi:TolA-binding protein